MTDVNFSPLRFAVNFQSNGILKIIRKNKELEYFITAHKYCTYIIHVEQGMKKSWMQNVY